MTWVQLDVANDQTRVEGFERILAHDGVYLFKRNSPKEEPPVRPIDG